MKKLICLFILLSSGLLRAEGELLSPFGYLNKMSMSLRGMAPSQDEYRDLWAAIQAGHADEFLKTQKTAYLSSTLFVEKMRVHLDDLFRLMPDSKSLLLSEGPYSSLSQSLNATDDLFTRIIAENGSWDRLLTEKTYNTFSKPSYGSNTSDEINFFSALDPKYSKVFTPQTAQEVQALEKHRLEFSPDDLRVAGVITSPRFFAHYGTTGVNKNRRRAATIFRTFLCDSMSAAVPDPGQDMNQIYNLQFPEQAQNMTQNTMTSQEVKIEKTLNDGIHGTQKDCMSCHYKLDPMGKTLRGSQFIPSAAPWAGSLTYKTAQGSLTNIPVKGIAELALAITKQPEYLNCQVGYFWNWFIGRDIAITPQIQAELTRKFDEVGRRAGDFISYLLDRPEFKSRIAVDPVRATSRRVGDLFARCQSCHQGKSGGQ